MVASQRVSPKTNGTNRTSETGCATFLTSNFPSGGTGVSPPVLIGASAGCATGRPSNVTSEQVFNDWPSRFLMDTLSKGASNTGSQPDDLRTAGTGKMPAPPAAGASETNDLSTSISPAPLPSSATARREW